MPVARFIVFKIVPIGAIWFDIIFIAWTPLPLADLSEILFIASIISALFLLVCHNSIGFIKYQIFSYNYFSDNDMGINGTHFVKGFFKDVFKMFAQLSSYSFILSVNSSSSWNFTLSCSWSDHITLGVPNSRWWLLLMIQASAHLDEKLMTKW